MVEAVAQNKTERVNGARIALVRGAYSEDVGGTKTLVAGDASLETLGSSSTTAGELGLWASGELGVGATGAFGASGSSVTLEGSDRFHARAGGAELLLEGSVLDLDGSAFAASGATVRLIGQVEMIEPDSAERPAPPEPGLEDDWIEITLLDSAGVGRSGVEYCVRLPDGSERTGTLDSSGQAREDGIPPGTVRVSFPGIEAEDTST